jgi:glucose-1-phosphate cytidylyltransferase
MVEIGGRPILWHIMRHYATYGHSRFLLALGFKAEYIKAFFCGYKTANADFFVNLKSGETRFLSASADDADWDVGLIDTGAKTQTGGRVKRLQELVGRNAFFMTYGDGVSNVDLNELLSFHRAHGKLATLTAVRPAARFGDLTLEGNLVTSFREKNQISEGWVNGGFFVLEPGVFDYIAGDDTTFEREPMERLAADGQLVAYKHDGFWQPMDTIREVRLLNEMWERGDAPWTMPKR